MKTAKKEMKNTEMTTTSLVCDIKAGTECWAWQYDWPAGLSMPMLSMKPVRGILAEYPDRIGNTSRGPGWFVPYSGKSRKPAFTKAVRVESVNLHAEKDDAVATYNKAVQKTIAQFMAAAMQAQDNLVKTEELGFVDDELEQYPVMRADLSCDHESVITAMAPILELRPDYEGELMEWDKFNNLMDRGLINQYDGCAMLHVDGKGCDNVLIDMYRGMLYVQDKYMVPFEHIPTVLAGHSVQVLWMPK